MNQNAPIEANFLPPSLLGRPDDWALFLDIDGTLLDIAERPDGVEIPASLTSDLQKASARLGGAMALISGRAMDWIDRAFCPLRLPAAGQHGAEIRLSANGPVFTPRGANLDGVRVRVRGLARTAGIEIEDKGLSIAIHYRHAQLDRREAAALIATTLGTLSDDLEILPGQFVYDIKPRGVNKGTAIARLAALPPFIGRKPVFVGDDHTDRDGFREVLERGGIAIQVGPSPAEPGCQWLPNPAAMREWLARLSAAPTGSSAARRR